MNRLAGIIVRYPGSIILGCALITLFLALGITRLETRNNYEGDLPESDPIIRTNARFEKVFGNEQIMVVAVQSNALFSPESLEKVKRISDALATVQGVPQDGVTSLATLPAPQIDNPRPGPSTLLTELLEHPGAIDAYRKQIFSDDSPAGRLVSKDGSMTRILVRIARTADQTTVARQVRDIVRRFEGPERIYAIGDFTVAQEIDDGIEGDLQVLLPLALALILAGFFASFRNLRGVALPLLVILLSIVWTLGLMGHLGVRLNVVTSTIPILLVAAASSYGIHVIHRHNEVLTVHRLLQRLGPPILLTGLTSVIGTLTLLVFRVTSIREFGVFAATGILSAALLALILVPAVLTFLKQPKKDQQKHRPGPGDRILLSLGTFSLKRRRLVMGITLLLILVSGFGITRIRLGLDPVELFPQQHPVRDATRIFNDHFTGCRYFNIMVEGNHAGAVNHPAFLKTLFNFQQAVEKLPKVTGSRSIIDALGSTLHEKNVIPFTVPGSQLEIERALHLYAASGGERDLATQVDKSHRRARVTVMVTATDQEEQAELYHRLQDLARAHFPAHLNVEFGGAALLWIAQNHYIAIGKVYNIIAAICLVFLFCALAFRSPLKGLLSVAPLAVATLITFGVMGLFGIRLNIVTAIITAIAVGIGVDFAIHFFSRLQEEQATGHTLEGATRRTMLTAGKAICFDVASNVLGFIVFSFSGFTPIQNFGWLISLTMLTCAFGTLVLLPPLAAFAWKKTPLMDHHKSVKQPNAWGDRAPSLASD